MLVLPDAAVTVAKFATILVYIKNSVLKQRMLLSDC